jgi:hypothetical protein
MPSQAIFTLRGNCPPTVAHMRSGADVVRNVLSVSQKAHKGAVRKMPPEGRIFGVDGSILYGCTVVTPSGKSSLKGGPHAAIRDRC